MNEIKFKCPKCTADRLEEIMVNATVSSDIDSLKCDGHKATADYGKETSVSDGKIIRYQCGECGHILRYADTESVITNLHDIAVWCEDNCEQ